MALLIRCPECEAQNRTADKTKGKNISCSVCGISFKVTDKAEFVADAPKEEVEKELDDEDKPQKRKSKRSDLDDDDDKPRKGKSRSRDDDDEDEDRPRRGRSNSNDHARGHTQLMGSAGMSNQVKVIGGIVGGVFVLGIIGVVFWQINKAKTTIDQAQQQQQQQQQPPKLSPYQEAVANIRKADGNAKRAGLRWFVANNPENPQEKAEVLPLILAQTLDGDGGIAREAINAIRKWGSAENTLDVVKVVTLHGDRGVREMAMDLLGEWKDVRAVDTLLGRLTQPPFEDRRAAESLQKIGTPAEDGILAKFDTLNAKAQTHACRVLGQVGTQKSVPKLEEVQMKAKAGKDIDSRALSRESNNALIAIRLRKM